jgi:hypothetical protein
MKILLWCVALFLAVLWTGCIALFASAANWLAGAGGQWVGAVQQVAEWPVPAWASYWVNAAWLDAVRVALTWSIDFLVASAPWVFSILAWIAPLLWTLWVLGMLVLALVVVVGLVLLGRVPKPAVPASV